MNMTRILILGAALGAAALAAFLVRGLIGGQNNAEAMPKMDLAEIMVSSKVIEAGAKIMPGDLKWQGWPKSALDAIPLRMVSQAASRRNITFVLRDSDVPQAMMRLHDMFF